MTALTFTAMSNATKTGITWGYNIGAGSNDVGTDIGTALDGFPCLYAHMTTLAG